MDGAGQVSVGDANDRTQIIRASQLAPAMIHCTEVLTTRGCMRHYMKDACNFLEKLGYLNLGGLFFLKKYFNFG